MPLSFGILLGTTIAVIGAILFFATKHKKIAKLIFGTGVTITLLTVLFIVLAVNSQM